MEAELWVLPSKTNRSRSPAYSKLFRPPASRAVYYIVFSFVVSFFFCLITKAIHTS